MANAVAPNVRLPDIIGSITRAQSSPYATKAMQEVSHIGQFVSNSSKSARFHENGILRYAQTVTELDVTFLEHIRDEAAQGMDAFDLVASIEESSSSKQVKLASYLLTVLERIAARLEAYYSQLSQESIYRPEIENNPPRTRWNNVRRKIVDGSFFLLAKPPSMESPSLRQNGLDVDFASIFAGAQQTLQHSTSSFSIPSSNMQQNRRLADMHTARAAPNSQAPSTFELQQQDSALRRMSTFINDNMSTIRRLSRLPAEYDFANLMATYGKHPQQTQHASGSLAQKPGSVIEHGAQNLHIRGNPSTSSVSTLPAPTPVRVPTQTSSLDMNFQLNRRPSPASTRPNPQPKDRHSPTPSTTSGPQTSPSAAMNAAMAHLNRRQPPRSTTALPASPRASLALSAASSRKKMTTEGPAPPMPVLPPGLAGFQQFQAKV
jgi:hypothetical protein